MKGRLSYKQLHDEIEALNTSVFDSLLNEDFEGFQNTIDEFADSGIMEQEELAAAREATATLFHDVNKGQYHVLHRGLCR